MYVREEHLLNLSNCQESMINISTWFLVFGFVFNILGKILQFALPKENSSDSIK